MPAELTQAPGWTLNNRKKIARGKPDIDEQFMNQIIEAIYDGAVFRPSGPITLAPNTRVRITIETEPPSRREVPSFLRTARALELDAPPDWSSNIDEYLYGRNPY